MLQATGITARFGNRVLFADLDFTLGAGEMVGLIGPNGAGKTTLLRILAHLHRPDAGEVRYGGVDAARIGARERARHVSYLAQNGDAHWPMQVETLVGLGRLAHRRALQGHSAADRAAIERALSAAGITDLRHRTMAHLSGGERMRVLLARALAVEAAMLLADEPVAALDPLHQLRVMGVLRETARQGQGVIVVLHDLSLAARFCDTLVLIADGGVVARGAARDVLTGANLTRAFGVETVQGVEEGLPFFLPKREAVQIGE